jgi:hypothetical protein
MNAMGAQEGQLMKRIIGTVLALLTMAIAATALVGGPAEAEAQPPKYMWEPIIFQECLNYPCDCDRIIVPG